ncbi:MAG: HPF/RaiA family ribosome-associated protein [Nitrospirae bacterium]|nr:HPF/RaiA family ribosome-associated protein [Nitrospirota bacterium]MBI3352804.1 HPF/RaiA family ribosome-associated protein [Nitrospirota bacterium]
MKIPLQITVHNLSLSEAAEIDIREKAANLDSLYPNITGCRVVVDAPHRHQQKGVLYNVRIDLTVPGKEFIIRREAHEDVYVSIRDAFDAARRQLEEFDRRQRGVVKTHGEVLPVAQVIRLFPEKGYGFIETHDGREVYFHRNSVSNGNFEHLKVGSDVRFVEELGEKGPQASTVQVLGRLH